MKRIVTFVILGSFSFLDASLSQKEQQNPAFLRYELANVQAQMQVIQEKMQNQEDIIEALKRDLDNSKKRNQEETKGRQGNVDQKLTAYDSNFKGFVQDLKELKNHTNSHAALLQESEAHIKDLEKTIQKQNESIEHLKSALSSLLDGFKGQDAASGAASYTLYEVKSGDSLGLIAQRTKTSIKMIKELNQLKNDAIFTGQKLKIPDKQ